MSHTGIRLAELSTEGLLLDRGGGFLSASSSCDRSEYITDLNSLAKETE